MLKYVVAYAATAVVFFGLDLIWLTRAVGLYREHLGGLLLDKPKLGFAAAFYLVYVFGIVCLAIAPALTGGGWPRALLGGALLGLVAYGTYDMTNMSTLKGWSLTLAIIDIAWGTLLTAVAATAGYAVTAWLMR